MRKLAQGNTAEVFEWDKGRVLKLWLAPSSRQQVEYEAMIGRTMCSSGLAAPAVFDVVEYEGRFGILYACVPGISLKAWMFSNLDRIQFAAQWLGRLHAAIHTHAATNSLPSHRARIRSRIETLTDFPDAVRGALLTRLDELPSDAMICHGDFHPDNVLVDGDNAVVIDWLDAASGPPVADVTRTILLIDGAQEVPATIRETVKNAYLDEYARHHALDRELLVSWYPVLAAARLSEGIPQDTERLRTIVMSALAD